MARVSARGSTTRASFGWAAAAAAASGLATISTPVGVLVPYVTEAFLAPSSPTASRRADPFHSPCRSPSGKAFREGRDARAVARLPEYGNAGELAAGTTLRRRTRSRSAAGRPFCLSASDGNEGGETVGEDAMSGLRDDEKFPDKPAVFSPVGGGGVGHRAGDEGEGDGSWTDEEVERQVAARKATKFDPYAAAGGENDYEEPEEEGYLEIIANMTKPLGITIEASTDKEELIYITNVGEQAEACGLEVGDVLTGVSGVFGGDIWSVKDKSIDKVRSLVRTRHEPYILVRVERGHISLEERCQEGYGVSPNDDCWRLTEDGECEVEYSDLWTDVYKEELSVLEGGQEAGGGGAAREATRKRTNEPPPSRGAGLGWDDSWGESDF